MSRVLVTGASGFIGESLCRALVEAGQEVVGLARRIPPEEKRISGVEYVVGDVRDAASLPQETIERCEQIVHTVGIITEVHGRGQTFEVVHVEGTRNLLRAARRGGLTNDKPRRFVYLSALGAAPDAPSAYARSKAIAETLVRDGGLPYTIFRPSIVLGKDAAFLQQIEGLIRRPPLTPFPLPFIPVPGSGRNRFQPVFIDDLCACVVRSLDGTREAKANNQSFEVGGADAVTFEELIRAIATHLGVRKRLLHVPQPFLYAAAAVLEALLPVPPITTDQLLNLRRDNVCDTTPLREVFDLDPLPFATMLERIYRET